MRVSVRGPALAYSAASFGVRPGRSDFGVGMSDGIARTMERCLSWLLLGG